MTVPRGPPHITGCISSSGGSVAGVTLRTWASTCLYWSENKDSIVQNIVVIVHVAFTQVWQSSESFDDKAGFSEHLRQAIHLLFPILSLDFQNFWWFLPLATYFLPCRMLWSLPGFFSQDYRKHGLCCCCSRLTVSGPERPSAVEHISKSTLKCQALLEEYWPPASSTKNIKCPWQFLTYTHA